MTSRRLPAIAAGLAGLVTLGLLLAAVVRWPGRAAQAARVVPVEAEVAVSRYREWRSGKSTRCEYAFRFEYDYEGERFESENLANWGLSSSCRDRGALLAGLPVGRRFTAYHDPQVPAESFASPVSALMLYYLPVVLGLVVIATGLLLRTQAPLAQRTTDPRGLHLLRITLPLGELAAAATIALAWWIVASAAAFFFWRRALIGRGIEGTDSIVPLVGLLVVGGTALLFRARRQVFDDPSIAVAPYPLARGHSVIVRVAQRVRAEAEIHAVHLRIEGRWQRGKQSAIVSRAEHQEPVGRRVSAGTVLTHEFTLDIPLETDDRLATSWALTYFVDGPGVVNHRVSIPIQVQ